MVRSESPKKDNADHQMKTWCTIELDRTRENILQTCIECFITKDNVFQLNAFQNEKIFGEFSSPRRFFFVLGAFTSRTFIALQPKKLYQHI